MATYPRDATKAARLEFITPKDPSDVVSYVMNFSADIASSDTVSSITVTPEAGITVDSSAQASGVVSAVLSGGTAGRRYDILYEVTTAAGVTLNATGVVRVANR